MLYNDSKVMISPLTKSLCLYRLIDLRFVINLRIKKDISQKELLFLKYDTQKPIKLYDLCKHKEEN